MRCRPCLQAKRSAASLSGWGSMMRSGLGLRSKSSPAVAEEVGRLEVARCNGNWLSHLDWDGDRCGGGAAHCSAGRCEIGWQAELAS